MQENIDADDETFITILFGGNKGGNVYQLSQMDIIDKSENSIVSDVINQMDLFF